MLVFFNQILGSDFLSGGEKIIVELLRRWMALKEITIVVPEHGVELIRKKEGLDVKYVTLPITIFEKNDRCLKHLFLIPAVWIIHTYRTIRKIFKNQLVDKEVLCSGDFFCNVIPACLLKCRDKSIKLTVAIFHIIYSPLKRKSGHSFISNLASYLFQRISFWFIKRGVDKIFVLNEQVSSELSARGFDRDKFYVLGGGIDLEAIDSVPPSRNAVYDGCFMARFSPTKGVFDLSEIWQKVTRKNNMARLLVIGGGLENEECKMTALINRYQANKQINRVGLKTGEEKYSLMKSCKIFVFPSYEEGFALSILEAMACRLPVVAWDLPVYQSIYKDAIVTVPIGDIGMFSMKVQELLEDESLRLRYAQRGYELSRNYDWDVVAQKAYYAINN